MWKKNHNLNNTILIYFLLFSIIILILLWLFQFIFFNSFYRSKKINDVKEVATKLKKNKNSSNFANKINDLAFDKSVCIEITGNNYDLLYSSTYFGKGCFSGVERTYNYKSDFINNNYQEKTYELNNEKFNTSTIVDALKLDDDTYAFINTSLEPVDGIVTLIRKELIVITLLILLLSYIIAYYISKHISKPIKDISDSAKELAEGNFNTNFKESNIEEIDELSKTLNYTKNELSKTDELRRDLMANVSHDLKTPLTMIKAYAEMSIDLHSKNKAKREEDIKTIISEVDRLTYLVNDILTLSKVQSKIGKLDITEFDLIILINDILNKYKPLQIKENYKFNFIHDKDVLLIKADKNKIEQVIYNLINNAINYTGSDNLVEIIVSSDKDIKVEIKDTGKGIDDKDLPYIWDKYYKNKKKHKRNLVGTGLGLSIVKSILEEHNYKYGVNTKKNEGTCFYFIIPKRKEK